MSERWQWVRTRERVAERVGTWVMVARGGSKLSHPIPVTTTSATTTYALSHSHTATIFSLSITLSLPLSLHSSLSLQWGLGSRHTSSAVGSTSRAGLNSSRSVNRLWRPAPFRTQAATSRNPASSEKCSTSPSTTPTHLRRRGPHACRRRRPLLNPTADPLDPAQTLAPSGPNPPTPARSRRNPLARWCRFNPPASSSSGPLGLSAGRRSGQLEPPGSSGKVVYGSSVTSLNEEAKLGFKVSKPIMWVVVVVAVMGLVVGAFLMVAVKNVVILVAVGGILVPVVAVVLWNWAWKKSGLLGFLRRYPNAELRGAVDGQFVKVTGVVTCGSIPLESSFQRVPRCVYVSTELYEYRGWGGKSANSKHGFFSWGCRHAEKYVADFYISDFQSGLRALVKSGYGAKVGAFVKPTTIVDITTENRELSPGFQRWLADRSLSSDDRVMRLKEGYIREGSTVSVMGVVRRQDNVLMIVPSPEPVATGCRWTRCLLPTYVEGLILTCDESQTADVIPV
ncbi:ubiquitin-specific protease family C19-related protein [Actinidia rufa]|uniref:Ubiquitin-specific protease family C19-related protein n=1 Tax=Actinidia rufa TaxID=165716 RepID=A0A7J0F1D3_9ERIC|nr:ubiquitin-specific protease family C19-related protein [Actinidia rufa]